MMLKWGIRSRLMTSFMIVISLSLSLVGTYVLWYFYNHDLKGLLNTLSVECNIAEQLLRDEILDPVKRNNIDNKVKEMGNKVGLRLTIIDQSGRVIADSNSNPALMENHSERPEVIEALAGKQGTAIRYSTTKEENQLYVTQPVYDGNQVIAVLRIATSLNHVEEGFSKIRNAILAALFLTLLLSIGMSMRLARKYTEPLEEITEAAQKIADGKLTTRIYLKTNDELEILSHAMNNLTSHLEDKINETSAEKHKLELILEHMDNGVIMFDMYGKVITVNLMAVKTFNITKEMIGQHNMNVIGKSLLDRSIHETLLEGTGRVIELKTQVNKSHRVFHISLVPILDNDSTPSSVLAVFHDITVLQEINDRQADFVANASHELATPLTAIRGFAETLLDGALQDATLSEKFVRIIYNEAQRMTRLTKDLLQLAKLNSQNSQQKVEFEPTSVGPLCQRIVDDMMPYWENKKLTLKIAAASKLVFVKAHPDWLKQVLTNLLENSVKYTPEGGSITLSYSDNGTEATISVQDTGVGIPSKDLPFIFERFYRVDRARSRAAGGTGLGLAIVKLLIDMLDGKIAVKSEVNVGSTFTITLPLATEFA
jgi:two-component system, OmpR family, phosphate regulon sensor histidine kinase PhoR